MPQFRLAPRWLASAYGIGAEGMAAIVIPLKAKWKLP
jgi:hypothetical protein